MVKRYAVVKEGRVHNIIAADDEWVAANTPGAVSLDADTAVNIGDVYDGQTFAPAPPAPEDPDEVDRRACVSRIKDLTAKDVPTADERLELLKLIAKMALRGWRE